MSQKKIPWCWIAGKRLHFNISFFWVIALRVGCEKMVVIIKKI